MMRMVLRAGVFAAVATAVGCGARPDASTPDETPAGRAAATETRRAVVRPDTGDVEDARRVEVMGVDLTGIGYDRGSPTAPVVVVNFSDFGCPYCAQFARETEPVIDEQYVKTGKVYMKYVPFVMGTFRNADQAARAAECAGDQGKFLAMHDQLYRNQDEWRRSASIDAVITTYAQAAAVERTAFDACYRRDGVHPRTERANDATERLGIRVTPSFVINGRGVEGALPLAQFRQLLDAAVAGGAP